VHVRQDVTDATAIVTTNRIANIYSYYITTQSHPILTLELDSTRINAGAWAITKSQLAVGNPGLVGVEENTAEPVFTTYPNPATDLINVAFENGTSVATKIEVIDSRGAIVRNAAVVGGRGAIATQGLDAGLYTLRVTAGDRVLGTSRVTVM
ncbi:MAG TPA: T9SS type A sorting domain-containing protein, partial [Flavobacteriales bacterium]|nr:T9SS type A sorting domain-containing protein [Flavobacteriales bacterium]